MHVATSELARQLEQIAADYLVSRYSGPGNPMGTEILRGEGFVATKVPFAPSNMIMNRAHGLEREAQLTEVLAFYAATNQPCGIEVLPCTPVSLTAALVRAGFRPGSYSATSYAPIDQALPARTSTDTRDSRSEPAASNNVDIRLVDTSELGMFLDTMNTGFGTPEAMLASMRRNQGFWSDVSNWHLLLARVNGQPAGAAVLSIHGSAGYLAAATTLPPFRNRGVQQSLIDARIRRTREHGCTLITGQAAWGSTSHGNQQRAGLALCHVKTLWTNQAER